MSKLKSFHPSSKDKEIRLLLNLIENASDGIHILDQKGNVVYCSNVFAELLGYSIEEAQTLNVRDWDRQFPVEDLIPILLTLLHKPNIFITVHEKKNGDLFDVEINARGIEIDGKLFLYASARDITQFKRESIENKKNNAKLHSIFRTMPDAIFVVNEEGEIETINDKSSAMFGYDENELLGKNINMLIPSAHRERYQNFLENTLHVKNAHLFGRSGEFEAVRKNGSVFPIEVSVGEANTDEGRLFTAIIRDITETKKQHLALVESEKMATMAAQAKSLFLANMSHEIRTPMNGIIGTLSLIEDGNLTDKQKEMLSTVKSCGENLLTIINDILDYSKIESGKFNIENEHFDLFQTVNEILALMSSIGSEKHIAIHKVITGDVPQYVVGDPVRLRQVLINLLSNAIKFSPNGSHVHFKLKAIAKDSQRTTLKFCIEDQGIGMTLEEQGRLFQAFTQAQEGTTRKYGGTGLGLSICQKLLDLMGGKITVESAKDQGSTFSFELEMKIGLAPHTATETVIDSNLSARYPYDVLLVEDNLINQVVAKTMLENLGYKPVIANHGLEAVDLFKENYFPLVFMDMQMPVMDGITATQEILKHYQNVKFIAMTANAMREDKDKCFAAGMKGFVTKPIKIQDIAEAIIKVSS